MVFVDPKGSIVNSLMISRPH